MCFMVGSSQARRWGVGGAAHTEHVCLKYQKQSVCSLQPGWRAQCESGSSARLLSESPTVHHCSRSPLLRVSHWMSMGKSAYKWPSHHLWIAGGTAREAGPLEVSMEEKGLRLNMGKSRFRYPGRDLVCFRSPAKKRHHSQCDSVSRVSAQTPSSVTGVPVGSTRDAVVSLALWSRISLLGVNGVLEWSEQWMADQW